MDWSFVTHLCLSSSHSFPSLPPFCFGASFKMMRAEGGFCVCLGRDDFFSERARKNMFYGQEFRSLSPDGAGKRTKALKKGHQGDFLRVLVFLFLSSLSLFRGEGKTEDEAKKRAESPPPPPTLMLCLGTRERGVGIVVSLSYP